MTVPSGGEIKDTVIRACVVDNNNQIQCGNPNSKTGTVTLTGSSVRYTFSNVASGRYVVVAFKDLDVDGSLGSGDYFGCFGEDAQGNCAIVQPPRSGIDIQMNELSGSLSARLQEVGRVLTRLDAVQFEPIQPNLVQASPPMTVLTAPTASVQGRPAFVPGEVIVKFRDSVGLQGLSNLQAQVGNQVLSAVQVRSLGAALPRTSLYRASTDAAGTLELVRALSARPDVEYAEPNYISYALKTPNDTRYNLQWHYRAMNLENAWDVTDGTTGTPVTVAVVDTGSINHPDLQGTFVGGYDFITSSTSAGDGNGRDSDPTDLGGDSGYHGSHVAGTVAARSNNALGVAGVSWGAKVVPVRVLGVDGSGTNADILPGVQWAAGLSVSGVPNNPNPAKVINMSLGGSRSCSQTEQQLYDNLKAQGVIVVVAAGNENDDANNHSPASCQSVITVGATGPTGERAPYSNYGSPVDVMAPGGDTKRTFTVGGQTYPAGVLSPLLDQNGNPAYGFYQGTSMASPHVAGLAALILSREPNLNFDAMISRLRAASTPLSATTCNRPSGNECGAGLVDALRAINGTGSPGNPPPPPGPPAPPPPPTGSLKTYVAALKCAQASNCTLFDEDGSVIIEVQADRIQVPFKLERLTAGTYVAAGWQDVNNNIKVDAGEPFGVAASPFTIGANQNLAGLIIRMKPFTPASAVSTVVTNSRLEDALRYLSRQQRLRRP